MRKMTKTVAVLAAMSAMTVASASLAFAATGEVKNLKALNTPEEAAAVGEGAGTWSGSNKDGWKFKTEDGTQLKNTWAQIDGVWYYFDGDKIVQDRVLYIDGASYYFDANGTLATGWQKITSKMDAYSDIEIPEDLYYDPANSYVDVNDAYDYEDYVWCYFHEDGKAAENEWFKSPESGLWYYFDENVMVKNIYNYEIEPDNYDVTDSNNLYLYGFDKNGAMLVGWNYKEGSKTWNDPTANNAGKTWYYYNSNGKMQTAGWKQIDGDWYLFADYSDASKAQKIGYPLIVNSYVKSAKADNDFEYFYVNNDGKMQKGVTTIPNKAWKVTFYVDSKDVTVTDYESAAQTPDKTIEVNLGSKGAATEGVVGDRYYSKAGANTIAIGDTTDKVNNSILTIANDNMVNFTIAQTVAVTGSAFTFVAGDTDIKCQLVKSAFIGSAKDTLYMADKNGDFVTNKAVVIATDETNGVLTLDGTSYANAYILFGSDGKAKVGYDGKKKSITIGGRTYWATEYSFDLGKAEDVTIFVSNKDEIN